MLEERDLLPLLNNAEKVSIRDLEDYERQKRQHLVEVNATNDNRTNLQIRFLTQFLLL
jgi:hypothetical protein